MRIDDIPLWLLFLSTLLLVVVTIELGYLFGKAALRKTGEEKESPVSAIAAAVLALLAFILAFTFGIVADRFDDRQDLVREQANAIHTAYLRSDFLPQAGRDASKELYRQYVDTLVHIVSSRDLDNLPEEIEALHSIQTKLWDISVANVRAGDTTDISASYAESITDMSNVLATRIAAVVETRLPLALWISLYVLVGLAMIAVGYQTAIAGSRRTWMLVVLALSFSIVIVLIAELDDPERGYIAVPQQPMTDLQRELNE